MVSYNYNSLIADYRKNGYVIVDNYLPEDVANKLESIYSEDNNEWELFNQYRDQGYGSGKYGKHKTESPYFPGEDEVFTSKFWRNEELESSKNIEIIFKKHFIDMFNKLSESELTKFDIRCYKMDNGCHYRTHIDDWVGDLGCIYYINKKWIWDWGGILHVGVDNEVDKVVPIFPKFNRAVFVNHGGFKFPHFVSHVSDCALNPRFTMITFAK